MNIEWLAIGPARSLYVQLANGSSEYALDYRFIRRADEIEGPLKHLVTLLGRRSNFLTKQNPKAGKTVYQVVSPS